MNGYRERDMEKGMEKVGKEWRGGVVTKDVTQSKTRRVCGRI